MIQQLNPLSKDGVSNLSNPTSPNTFVVAFECSRWRKFVILVAHCFDRFECLPSAAVFPLFSFFEGLNLASLFACLLLAASLTRRPCSLGWRPLTHNTHTHIALTSTLTTARTRVPDEQTTRESCSHTRRGRAAKEETEAAAAAAVRPLLVDSPSDRLRWVWRLSPLTIMPLPTHHSPTLPPPRHSPRA